MEKCIYQVFINRGNDTQALQRKIAGLDTGVGSRFITNDALPRGAPKRSPEAGNMPRISDASNPPVAIVGRLWLQVHISTKNEMVLIKVVDRLATTVILWCGSCHKIVEAIRPSRRLIDLDGSTTVPIVGSPRNER